MSYSCTITLDLQGDGEDGPLDEMRSFLAVEPLPYMALDGAFQKLILGLDFKVKLHSADK